MLHRRTPFIGTEGNSDATSYSTGSDLDGNGSVRRCAGRPCERATLEARLRADPGRRPERLLRYLRVWRPKEATGRQLLSDQAWRHLHAVGHGASREHAGPVAG